MTELQKKAKHDETAVCHVEWTLTDRLLSLATYTPTRGSTQKQTNISSRMLSESHRGVYRRYKADTNVVAGWLASASSAHGYTMERVPAAKAPAAKGGRLKGKARKAAKQAEKTSVTTSSENDNASAEAAGTAPRKTYVIKIKDFEPMALFLSKVNGLKIPDYFQDALRRVIQGESSGMSSPETRLSLC